MLTESEKRKLAAKDREWGKIMRPVEIYLGEWSRTLRYAVHYISHPPKDLKVRKMWFNEITVWLAGAIMWTYIVAWAFRGGR